MGIDTSSIFTLESTPFCIEISLKTPENQSMILETWCLSFNDQLCDPTQKVNYSVYKKMSLILRSLIIITRSTPTYQLSRRQSSDTYVLLYRMYSGEPIVHHLGEKYATAKVGTIGTPIGSIMLNVAYRTRLTMTPTQNTNTSDNIYIKDDHFKNDNNNMQPINCNSAVTHTKTQPIQMQQAANRLDKTNDSSGDYSRNSSIASTPSDTAYYFKLKSAAFAPSSFTSKDIASSESNEAPPPFISLLCNEFAQMGSPKPSSSSSLISKQTQQSPPPPNTNQMFKDESYSSLVPINNRQIQQQQQQQQNIQQQQQQQDDFVFIESEKIAFGLSDAANDLSTFFRSCDNPPILDSFNSELYLCDIIHDLDQQLFSYEAKVAEFDDLVKSFEN
jgi:autophagy-related protein 13